jgi:hypothetical protein
MAVFTLIALFFVAVMLNNKIDEIKKEMAALGERLDREGR